MGKESNVVFQRPADGAVYIAGNFDLGLSLVEGPAFLFFGAYRANDRSLFVWTVLERKEQ
jgi:hypothetical protein